MRMSLVGHLPRLPRAALARAAIGLACAAHLVADPGRASAQGATRQIQGRILDVDGHAPVPAATVVVTGTTIGTSSSDSGQFNLRAPVGQVTLVVRRIGFRPANVPVAADQSDVTILLVKDVLQLEAQVVTGVATTVSSQNAANAVSVVNADQVSRVPAPTVENALQGKIPGALIQQNNGGAPGGGLQIQIRGVTSINSDASPLYVIDGVIVNNETRNSGLNAITAAGLTPNIQDPQDNSPNRIADLNANDIESIEVLKGATASAIYGSRAGSGVVIITTKKGSPGRASWDLTGRLGTFTQAKSLDFRSFPTAAGAEAWYNANVAPKPGAAPWSPSFFQGSNDFQNQLFGGGQASYEGDLSVRGISGNTQYYASAISKYDNGLMLNTGYNKQGARTNVTQTLSPALSASANLYYQHSQARRGVTGNDNVGISPYNVFAFTPQFFNLNARNPDGSYVINPYAFANPFADATQIQTPETESRFIGGGSVNWRVFSTTKQSLQFTAQGGADLSDQRDDDFSPPSLQVEQHKPLPGTANINVADATFINYSLNLVHHYAGWSFLDATTSVGMSRDKRTLDNPNLVGQDLPPGNSSPTLGAVQNAFQYRERTYTQSFYGQEQLITLGQRLTLTGGATAQRNSNDGSNGAYYLFPKFSAAYRIPRVAGFLDELKLRGAYGRSGTAPLYGVNYPDVDNYQSFLVDGQHVVEPFFNTALLAYVLNDPHIRPETNTEIETGFDATMFNSRAQFSATVYQKRVSDLVLYEGLATSSGWSVAYGNGGQFTNRGIELLFAVTPIQVPRGLTWVSTTTFFRNYSRVDALPVPAFQTGVNFGGPFGSFYVAPGRSVSEMVNLGLIGKDGLPKQVGDAFPSYVMSFENEFSLGAFHLSGLVDWHRGGTTVDLTNAYYDNGLFLLADSVASAKRQAAAAAGLTPYVEDASFVKVRELTASVDVPPAWVQRVGGGRLTSARLALSGRNLFTSYKYSGLDPEISNFGNQQVARAQDVTPYPPARSVFVSLNLGF
jgi:TonB-linked SusC/RagA family outer membrane protein